MNGKSFLRRKQGRGEASRKNKQKGPISVRGDFKGFQGKGGRDVRGRHRKHRESGKNRGGYYEEGNGAMKRLKMDTGFPIALTVWGGSRANLTEGEKKRGKA